MNEQIPLWLGRNARLPGIIAHAVLHPRQGCSAKNWTGVAKTENAEESLRALAALAEKAAGFDGRPTKVEWIFEAGWILGARLEDDTWAFVLISPDAAEEDVPPVRKLLDDFLNLS